MVFRWYTSIMKTILLLLTAATLLFSNERTQVHMGTFISVRIADDNLSDAVFALFADLDQRLSTYKSDSEISRLNREYKADLSPVTRDILERSIAMNGLTHGVFDVTVGSLTHGAYHFGTQEQLPTSKEIRMALAMVGGERIHINGDSVSVEPGTIIDLGGIAKGYAVDLASDMLVRRGVSQAVVAASGDIGCLGECEVKIADPFHPEGYIASVSSSLKRFAISTSGNYERYIRNKAHNHLLDPKTGLSEQYFASVTLMGAGDNTSLDALSTAVAVMGEKKAVALLSSMPYIRYYLVCNDGKVIQSQNLENWEGVRFSKVH